MVLGALGAQIESLRYGNLELILRRKADEAKLRGDPKSAEILEQAADTVSGRMTKTARSYESIRGGMAPSHERTKELDKIVEEARADAHNSNSRWQRTSWRRTRPSSEALSRPSNARAARAEALPKEPLRCPPDLSQSLIHLLTLARSVVAVLVVHVG